MSRSSSIPSTWFRHLPPDEQDDFKELLRSNHRVLGRLKEILEEDLSELERKEETDETYSAGYPYKQAYYNGQRKQIKQALKYLAFLED